MKIALLSDVHGNLPALQTVAAHLEAWQPDQVIVAGDLVNRGPRSRECLEFAQGKRGWRMLLGNHEEFVARHARPDAPRDGPLFELRRSSHFAYHQLGGDVSALDGLPFSLSLAAPDGREARFAHASMRGTRDGIYPHSSDDDLRQRAGLPWPGLFCAGHTHLPVARRVDGTLVVNCGSAGLPFDGDTRASYARLTWRDGEWSAEIVRLRYDLEQTDRDFADTGFLEEGGPLARLIRIELRTARSQLYQWTQRFEPLVLSGALSVEEAVDEYLEE
jgi:predicted phosphodiesterase